MGTEGPSAPSDRGVPIFVRVLCSRVLLGEAALPAKYSAELTPCYINKCMCASNAQLHNARAYIGARGC